MKLFGIDTKRAYLTRILNSGSDKSGNAQAQHWLPPNGCGPLNVSVAGVRYENRARIVQHCSLREKVRLCREPDNAADANAIKIVNHRGEKLGYIPKHLAARLAPYMDAGNDPIEAVITELTCDVPGSEFGARVGFYLPADLCTEIQSDTQRFDYYCDTGSSGTMYLLLDCDEGTLEQVKKRLTETGHTWVRYGISYRPASDGREYRWYVVLGEGITVEKIEEFFRDHFGILSQRERKEQTLNEVIEIVDTDFRTLREENDKQKDKIAALEEELRCVERRIKNAARRGEAEKVIQILLPNVEFLRNSIDVITRELKSYEPVLRTLYSIAIHQDYGQAKAVKGAPGWKELRFNTGQSNGGRLYFRSETDRYLTLISFKNYQKQDIEYLRKQ